MQKLILKRSLVPFLHTGLQGVAFCLHDRDILYVLEKIHIKYALNFTKASRLFQSLFVLLLFFFVQRSFMNANVSVDNSGGNVFFLGT